MTQTAETKTILTCRETELLLKIIASQSLRKKIVDLVPEEIDPIDHYLSCDTCRHKGLATISGFTSISCKEAVEGWLQLDAPRPLHRAASRQITSLQDQLYIEHIWGSTGQSGRSLFVLHPCLNAPCSEIAERIRDSFVNPRPPFYGEDYNTEWSASDIPMAINVFAELGLPLENLFKIQSERIRYLASALEHSKPPLFWNGNAKVFQHGWKWCAKREIETYAQGLQRALGEAISSKKTKAAH